MINTNKCKGCVWFDQCNDGEGCEFYTPISAQEEFDAAEEEYAQDLTARHDIYMKQTEEQDN